MNDDKASNGERWSRRRAIVALGGMVTVAGCLTESKQGSLRPRGTRPSNQRARGIRGRASAAMREITVRHRLRALPRETRELNDFSTPERRR
ncbi:hypothetical protein ACFFQF_25580 [Haladaptatus pallidirubidus]|uniref:hypothetical protein n=1 Tax=Haladaptatus pallidirubidus TaxID=1008152 RepID=UPI0035EAC7B0